MKRINKLLVLLLTFCVCISLVKIPANAEFYTGDWEYTLSEGNAIISAYSGTSPLVLVPTTIDGLTVVGIGDGVFEDQYNIIGVTLPDTLESIGSSAFKNCTSLTGITLPEKLESIGSEAFYNCTSLETITVNSKNLSNLYFYGGVGNTFYNAGKNTDNGIAVTFTDTVTRIPAHMFSCSDSYYARIKSVTIGSGVTEIAGSAFLNCFNLETVSIPTSSALETIEGGAFKNCTSLTSITLPEKLESVGNEAFYNCKALETITVNSKNLSNFYFYGGVGNTFYNAGKNTENGIAVTFTDTVTRIPAHMFSCSDSYYARIKSATIGSGVTEIAGSAFLNCYNLETVSIPTSSALESIEGGAFKNCTSLTSITLPSKLESVGNEAFYNCKALETITIKSKNLNNFYLYNATSNTFYNAGKNTENGIAVTFTDAVTRIPDNIFACSEDGYARIKTVSVGNNVAEIGARAFSNCIDLEKVTISSSSALESIKSYAFVNCTSLTSMTFPRKLESVGYEAFYNCESLQKITFTGSAPSMDSSSFYGVTATVHYPADSTWTASVRNDYSGNLTWRGYPVVKVTNVASTGKIKLSWNAVDGAVKYKVYRSTSKNGTYSLLTTVTGTSVTNTSAKAGTTYYYYVRAVDANGNTSLKSSVVYRTCDLARPTVTVSNVASTGKIKISWDAVKGAAKYTLYIYNSNGDLIKSTTTTKTALTHTSAVAGKSYTYKVRALCGVSAATSACSSGKTRCCDLARPTVSVTRNGSGKPVVSWDKVTNATKYKVYIYVNGELLKTTTVTGTKITHSSAAKGVTYTYRIAAMCSVSAASSAKSAAVSITSK